MSPRYISIQVWVELNLANTPAILYVLLGPDLPRINEMYELWPRGLCIYGKHIASLSLPFPQQRLKPKINVLCELTAV